MADEDYDDIMRRGGERGWPAGDLWPIPSAADAAIAVIWSSMLVAIARGNSRTLTPEAAKRIALAAIAGLGAKVPGIGMIGGAAANCAINIAATLWVGVTMIDLFERRESVDIAFCVEFVKNEVRLRADLAKLRRILR